MKVKSVYSLARRDGCTLRPAISEKYHIQI